MPTRLALLRPAATLAAAIFAVALGGCAPQPLLHPRYPDDPLAAAPIPPDRARMAVFRMAPEPHPWYFPTAASRRAEVELDGAPLVPDVDIGEYGVRVVTAGAHALRVGLSGWPGSCVVNADLAAGTIAYYQILPRPSYWHVTLAAQVTYGASAGIPLVGLLGMGAAAAAAAVAAAAESEGKVCGGPFSIAPVDEGAALPMLKELRTAH